MPKRWPLLLAVALALTACSTGGSREPNSRTSIALDGEGGSASAAAPVSPATGTGALADLPGRLAISEGTQALVVTDPDGSGRVELARSTGGDTSRVVQPVWSPDGSHLAWVEIDTEQQRSVIAIAEPDGAAREAIPSDPLTAFYLSWDPTSSRLAVLGNDADTVGLGIAERGGSGIEMLARGSPLYLAWAPDGGHLLTHIGERDLDDVSLSGQTRPASNQPPGSFAAPAWSDDGSTRVFAVRVGDGLKQELVAQSGGNAGAERTLLDYLGESAFVLSPDASTVAVRVPAVKGRDGTGGLLAIPTGGDRRPEIVTRAPVVSFSWSPDGRWLAFLSPVQTPQGVFAQWRLWRDGGTQHRFALFTPSELWATIYLPFFDQYAQSMSMWSPDSAAFAYPGTDPSGQSSGIWVQSLTPDMPVVRVAAGDVVTWSSDQGAG